MTIDPMNKKALFYWNENADMWSAHMGEGSPFQRALVEPKTLEFLDLSPEVTVLDLACGNGQMSRRLAGLGARVVGVDGSERMIAEARAFEGKGGPDYHVADLTKKDALSFMADASFERVLCNMALMDIEEIEPVFSLARRVLKPQGVFVFSITHPCFDKAVGNHLTELEEKEGALYTRRFIKIERYLSSSTLTTKALPSLPSSHFFFHRSLETYLGAAFRAGLVVSDLAEPAFAPDTSLTEHRGWHHLAEIPVVLIIKLQKKD